MKLGPRKPNIKKSIKAKTTGNIKRKAKSAMDPTYGKKGAGWAKDPKKAAKNKLYNETSFSVVPDYSNDDNSHDNYLNNSYSNNDYADIEEPHEKLKPIDYLKIAIVVVIVLIMLLIAILMTRKDERTPIDNNNAAAGQLSSEKEEKSKPITIGEPMIFNDCEVTIIGIEAYHNYDKESNDEFPYYIDVIYNFKNTSKEELSPLTATTITVFHNEKRIDMGLFSQDSYTNVIKGSKKIKPNEEAVGLSKSFGINNLTSEILIQVKTTWSFEKYTYKINNISEIFTDN